MIANRDLGLIPEPILEEMGARYGSQVRRPAGAGECGPGDDVARDDRRRGEGRSGRAAEGARVSAAGRPILGRASGSAGMGRPMRSRVSGRCSQTPPPPCASPPARALVQLGRPGEALEVLGHELGNKNLIVGHYAIWALEEIGAGAMPLLSQIQAARESPYDPTRRVAERLSKTLLALRAPQPD